MELRKRTFPLVLTACAAAWLVTPSLHAKPQQNGSLLIVAPREFQAALRMYVDYKSARMPTELIVLEDILKIAPGADDPERLKKYLYKRWHSAPVGPSRPRYILLVGDAEVMPVRYMVLDRVTEPAFDYAFYPSDLYYADIAKPDGSFENWNGTRGKPDGPEAFHSWYFGEVRGEKNKTDPINFDHIDYKPELAVGRWPVNSPDQVTIVAEKSMAYEKFAAEDKNGSRRAAFVAIDGWVDNRSLFDSLASGLPKGWTPSKLYYKDASGPGGKPDASETNEAHVVKLLNDGVGLVLHSGHGNDAWWGGSIGIGSIKLLHNEDRLPILISAGCSTARLATLPPYEAYTDMEGAEHTGTNFGEVFKQPPPPPAPYQKGAHTPTGMGKQMLRGGKTGAAAYIGCNTGSQPCGITLIEGFMDELSREPQPRLGDCWAAAVSYYYDHQHLADLKPNDDWYPPSIFFQGMKFMLYGDPSLAMPAQ